MNANPKIPRSTKTLSPSDRPGCDQGVTAGTREEELQRAEGMKIAQSAVQGIGMLSKDVRRTRTGNPNYALSVSLLFTRATNQTIMLGTAPDHVLSTSLLCNSLLHDGRFMQVPISRVAPGDIVVKSGSLPNGYAGLVVDHGRIVSDSGNGVRNDSSLVEIQHHLPPPLFFRYIGIQKYPGYSLANAGFNSEEPRRPGGQTGGGRWTKGNNSNCEQITKKGSSCKQEATSTNIDTVKKNLALDENYSRPKRKLDQAKDAKRGIYVTHYGPGTKIGGWDRYNDSGTNSGYGLGGKGGTPLKDNHSLALSADVAHDNGIFPGDPVYVNSHFIGYYDDRAPEPGTIDLYDKYDSANNPDWGGMVWGAKVTNHP